MTTARRRNPGKISAALRAALTKSEEFFGFAPRWIKRVRVTWPKSLVQIGDCARVDYVSDKFDGKVRIYFHEFGADGQAGKGELPRIFAAPKPQANGENMLVIVGRFKIEAEGIIG